MSEKKPVVAFIGLGIMGRHMAGHILAAGHPLRVYNRSAGNVRALQERGAVPCDSAGAAAVGADIVITMVGLPGDVESIYLGAGGIIESARPDAVLVDMTTSSPSLAERIAAAAVARGLAALDAPVSGGEFGARDARLSIMIGGDADAVDRVMPVLRLMGATITHMGGPGAGQHTKLANQTVIAGTMLGIAEGLAYAGRAGLDLEKVLTVLGGGVANGALLAALGPKMIKRDFAAGFFIEHFVKDMGLVHDEAGARQLSLPGLEAARGQYAGLVRAGAARDGTQALLKAYLPAATAGE